MGKCVSHNFWTPIFIDCILYQCGKDVMLPLYIIWNNLYNPIELLADVKLTLWLMLHQKNLQKIWHSGALQRRTYHQEPPHGS